MDVKSTLKAITLELRRELEGKYDAQGNWQAGDLERRLAAIGARRDRAPVPVDELPHLAPEDREARVVVDAFVQSRAEVGQSREAASAEFVRDAAYTWANRLLALRCMEARALIDEVILQKNAYGDRSLQHNRLASKQPERCAGEDEGLFAALFDEFSRRAEDLPLLFDPRAPEVALRPSVAALKRCIALLSGTLAVKGQDAATDEVFTAPDALGWTYQYWNAEEKDRVFEKLRTKKGFKIEGAEIAPATCIYTEPYMVKFLVQNSLGALWMCMHPSSPLHESWEYYVRDADRAPVLKNSVTDLTFLDPACGSGHFLLEAFDLFYAMYVEDGLITEPSQICAAILERNLHGIDIDERAVQIAALALVMKAKEKAPDFVPRRMNLVATNIRLPATKEHLDAFLDEHPEDVQLRPALVAIFEGLAHADESGSLLQLEEPVEKELRALKATYEAAGSPQQQQALWSEFQKPIQGKLPIGVASYEAWKERALARIHEHFDADARSKDLGTAFFGEAGAKGVSLVDVLSRRYDVVAANPPYMGSKNMGPVLKKHVERHFAPGKRDLYAAFILRCLELAAPGSGRIAMVTQQSWMFLRSFAGLRAPSEERRRKAPMEFGGLLRETTVETLGHLGPRAFGEIGGEVVNIVVFVAACAPPNPGHEFVAIRAVAAEGPSAKSELIRSAVRSSGSALRTTPQQDFFLQIPDSPVPYWLSPYLLRLLAGNERLSDHATTIEGLNTTHNDRFLRWHWEIQDIARWRPYSKGGGYRRWYGNVQRAVDWGTNGDKLKVFIEEKYGCHWSKRVSGVEYYDRPGWNWSLMARGSLGLRLKDKDTIFDVRSGGLFVDEGGGEAVAAFMCTRPVSYLLRAVSPVLDFHSGYVARLPVPASFDASALASIARSCVGIRRWFASTDFSEWSFDKTAVEATSGEDLGVRFQAHETKAQAADAVCATLEGWSDALAASAFHLGAVDALAVLSETGVPASCHRRVSGYESLPTLAIDSIEMVTDGVMKHLATQEVHWLDDARLRAVRDRLRTLYENGPGGSEADDEEKDGLEEEDEEEASDPEVGARVPIPTESFLQELAEKVEIHPISVYWLLRELREKDGVVCSRELRRFVEDYASAIVLQLLGHRWPRQIEVSAPLSEWADRDGGIPVTEGTAESSLLARVRRRLAADFGAGRVGAVEREFEEIIGKTLGDWLGSSFFKRHISQFRKRPIAWQLVSSGGSNERRRSRSVGRNKPAFMCLIYYQRLDTDLLPKLRTQYVGPLRVSLQTELGSLEKLKDRSADQDARRVELEDKIEELKTFDLRLEQVIIEGFASPALDEIVAKEPLDKWTSRGGRASEPEAQDAFLAQERRYDPDLNDGVRVNIAPFQRAGLLAADVLAAKDVEKAIADRAEWRADERRWCRAGKLPRPGWWRFAHAGEDRRGAQARETSA